MRFVSSIWPSALLLLACCLWGLLERGMAFPGQTHLTIWPPVGLLFVGAWLGRQRSWVGTYFAVLAALSIVTHPTTPVAIVASMSLASAYWLQSHVAVRVLMSRRLDLASPLTAQQIVLFLLWIGPVHTVFAACLAPFAMAVLQPSDTGSYFVDAIRFWWRDSISSILVTVCLVSLMGLPSESWHERRWTVGLPLLVAIILVSFGVWLAARRDYQIGREKVANEANLAQMRIQEQLDRTIATAMGSWNYIVEKTNQLDTMKSRDLLWSHLLSFRTFAPELVNVAFCPIVDDQDRTKFEQQLSQEADQPFTIKDRMPDGRLKVADRRPRYVPTTIQGLWFKNTPYLGLDLLNDPDRGPAIVAALKLRKPTSTGLVPMINDGNTPPVVIVICPQTHEFNLPPAIDPPPPQAEPASVLALVFDVQRLLSRASDMPTGLTVAFDAGSLQELHPQELQVSKPILFADKPLTLKFQADYRFLQTHREHTADYLATISQAILIIITGLFLIITGQTLLQESQVNQQMLALRHEVSAREVTEAWLRRSEARLSQAQLMARLGYWEWDAEQDRIYCSHSLAQLLGDETSIILKVDSFLQRVHPDDREQFSGRLLSFGSQPDENSIEIRLLRSDGTMLWTLCTMVMTGNDYGPSLRGTVQDITALKQNQLALEAQGFRLRVALAAANMGTWEWDFHTKRLTLDDQQQRIFGFTPGTFDGELSSVLDRIDPAVRDKIAKIFASQSDSYGNDHGQFRIVLPDGSIRWIEAHASILPAVQDQPKRMIGVSYDITARKQTESALLASQAHLAQAQKLARLGSWEWDLSTHTGHWSSELYDILQLDPAVPAQYPLEAPWIHPADLPIVERARQQLEQPGSCCKLEFRALRLDQSVLYLSLEACHELVTQSQQHRVLGIIQDISQRKLAEEQRRQFDERLQEIQRLESLGILAGGVAHDFNNLLTGILGNAMFALERVPPESELRELLQPIEQLAQHAAELCHQLLAYAGRGIVARGIISLNSLIQESEELLRLCVPKPVQLLIELAGDLEPIEGDASQLRQVLINLVQNAGEAIGNKSGRILVRTESEPDAVILHIEDTGCGMDPATLARIFEPFFTTKFAGRGIGLSAVHGIVSHHKGTWDIRSTPGQGSTFRLRFPAAGATSPTLTTVVNQASTESGNQADASPAVPQAVTIGLTATMQAIVKTSLQSVGLTTHELPLDRIDDSTEWPNYLGPQTALLIWDCTTFSTRQNGLLGWLRGLNPRVRLLTICPEEATPNWEEYEEQGIVTLTPPLRTFELVTLVRQLIGADATEAS